MPNPSPSVDFTKWCHHETDKIRLVRARSVLNFLKSDAAFPRPDDATGKRPIALNLRDSSSTVYLCNIAGKSEGIMTETLLLEEPASKIDIVRELRLRQWARQNFVPTGQRKGTWHPVVLDEMRIRDRELASSESV